LTTKSPPPNTLRHVAIIMDGNNRWAKQRNLPGISGHKAGVERIRDMLTACREHGITVLTVFAFSSENWQRPRKEVDALMTLFQYYLTNESKKLKKEGVRLQVIGRRDRFSPKVLKAIEKAEKIACEGEQTLVIAADYGGQWDMAQAAQRVVKKVIDGELALEDIEQDCLDDEMCLTGYPPLDLLIRTGNEQRVSNFLLWQLAYAELHFSPLLWPDFDSKALDTAVNDFYQRQRRFGLTGE